MRLKTAGRHGEVERVSNTADIGDRAPRGCEAVDPARQRLETVHTGRQSSNQNHAVTVQRLEGPAKTRRSCRRPPGQTMVARQGRVPKRRRRHLGVVPPRHPGEPAAPWSCAHHRRSVAHHRRGPSTCNDKGMAVASISRWVVRGSVFRVGTPFPQPNRMKDTPLAICPRHGEPFWGDRHVPDQRRAGDRIRLALPWAVLRALHSRDTVPGNQAV